MDLVAFEVSIFLARLSRATFESAKVVVVFCVHNIFRSMFERQRLLQRLCNKAGKKEEKKLIFTMRNAQFLQQSFY